MIRASIEKYNQLKSQPAQQEKSHNNEEALTLSEQKTEP